MIPIDQFKTEFGTIDITRSATTGALIYKVDGRQQGAVDGQGTSLAYYIHALFSLIIQADAHNILMIGGAGCTLGTMLSRAGRKVTIVDVNQASFDIARQYFGLPDSIPCHIAEGADFLRGTADIYDAIVLDAFHGDFVPSHLKSAEFCGLVQGHLRPEGVFLANLLALNDFDDCADRLAKTLKEFWPDVRVLDSMGIRDRNAIVMAGRVSQLREPELLVQPEQNAKIIKGELKRMQFRRWKSSRFDLGG
jgi:spermidine synthase